jgi:hypothetical protein
LTIGAAGQVRLDVGRRLIGVLATEQEIFKLFALHGFSKTGHSSF